MAEQPLWTGAVSAYPWSDALASQFTAWSRFEDLMTLYTKLPGGLIGLPRHCCPVAADDRRVLGEPIRLKSKVVPRNPEQARVIKEMNVLAAAQEDYIARSPTGSGKTIMTSDVICNYGRTTLVVCPKEDLLDQWAERLVQATTCPAGAIGRIQQDTVKVRGFPIVLASLQSLAKIGRYPPWVYEYFGLVVFDEVHRLGADTFSTVAGLFPARLRIGLSATPARTDGKELMFEAHIGPVRVVGNDTPLTPTVLRFQSTWKCPRWSDGKQMPHKPGRIANVVKSLATHGERNQMLSNLVGRAYRKGRKIVVFSDSIEHLETLEGMIPRHGVPSNEIGRYYGRTTKAQLTAAAAKRVILATYKKMSEGTDIPELDTLVMGTPISNIVQAVGRILRIFAGKRDPVVIDIVDADSKVLQGYARTRQRFYNERGAEVKDLPFTFKEEPRHVG